MLTSKHLAAASAVVGFLAFDFMAPTLLMLQEDLGMGVAVGVIVGQVNLIATWGALGPGNVVVRLPWSILLGAFSWYSIVLGIQAWSTRGHINSGLVLLGPVILGGVVVAQIPLWIGAKSFRWRLINLKNAGGEPADGPLQFNVRHMLVVMFLVALALGPARLVLPPEAFDGLRLEDEMVVILAALVGTNLVMTVPCIWGALIKTNPVPPLAWPVYCAVVTAVEFGSLCMLLGPPSLDWSEALLVFFLLNLSQCATVYFALRLFRAVGFRLVRAAQEP
jgi:hypothetical protein